jgi:GGDEF domain-containing protein
MQALSLPIHIDGADIVITGSLGCAEFPNHGADQRALLGSADAAMRRAKAAGGNCHVVFDTSSPDHQNAKECA